MEDLKERVRRAYDALSIQSVEELAAEVFGEEAELVGPTAGRVKGMRAIADHWKNALDTTPDARATIDRIIREGNVVVVEYTLTGTNTGPLRLPTGENLPATNKKVTFPAVDIWTFEGGKAVSQHLYFDRVAVLAQLGLMPAPAGLRSARGRRFSVPFHTRHAARISRFLAGKFKRAHQVQRGQQDDRDEEAVVGGHVISEFGGVLSARRCSGQEIASEEQDEHGLDAIPNAPVQRRRLRPLIGTSCRKVASTIDIAAPNALRGAHFRQWGSWSPAGPTVLKPGRCRERRAACSRCQGDP